MTRPSAPTLPPASTGSDNRKGAAFMVGSMTFFVLNDAFMKALGAEWPLFQSLFIRGIGVVLVMLVLAAALGQLTVRLPRRDWLILLIRTLCEMGAAYFFISAIFNMPLADATTIMQSLPLTITMAGALFLGERVGPRRWAAIGVGFVGVILIVRPGFEGFSIYSVYVLITVVLITLRDMAVRQMSRSVPTVLTALLSAFGVMLLGAVGSVGEVWAPFSLTTVFALGGAIATVIVAYICSVSAMRWGDIGFVAPYRYTSIVVALIIGFAFFNEVPDRMTLIGAAIIVVTGLYTLYREQKLIRDEAPDDTPG